MNCGELRAQLTRRRAQANGTERRLLDSFGELPDSYDLRATQAVRQAEAAAGPGERIDLVRVATDCAETAAALRTIAGRALTRVG